MVEWKRTAPGVYVRESDNATIRKTWSWWVLQQGLAHRRYETLRAAKEAARG